MDARIWLTGEPRASRARCAIAAERTVVGRDPEADIHIDDEAVSWNHLEIESRGGVLMATDLDSRNGTALNGEPLDRPRRLRDGDTLIVGGHRLEVSDRLPGRAGRTVAAAEPSVALSEEERATAAALVAPYRSEGAFAGRPATRAEIAEALHVSERTAQRRLDALAAKLDVPGDAGRERPRLIAARVIELGLDRTAERRGPDRAKAWPGARRRCRLPARSQRPKIGEQTQNAGKGIRCSTERSSPHLLAVFAIALPAAAARRPPSHSGAVVFSRSRHQNGQRQRRQRDDDHRGRPLRGQGRPSQPADRRPDRHRTVVLAGQPGDRLLPQRRHLLGACRRLRPAPGDQRPGGSTRAPKVAPNGRYVRLRAAPEDGAPADLYTVSLNGGGDQGADQQSPTTTTKRRSPTTAS